MNVRIQLVYTQHYKILKLKKIYINNYFHFNQNLNHFLNKSHIYYGKACKSCQSILLYEKKFQMYFCITKAMFFIIFNVDNFSIKSTLTL